MGMLVTVRLENYLICSHVSGIIAHRIQKLFFYWGVIQFIRIPETTLKLFFLNLFIDLFLKNFFLSHQKSIL